jgi:hypothetical protein
MLSTKIQLCHVFAALEVIYSKNRGCNGAAMDNQKEGRISAAIDNQNESAHEVNQQDGTFFLTLLLFIVRELVYKFFFLTLSASHKSSYYLILV